MHKFQVVAIFFAVSVDGVHADFTGTELHALPGPFQYGNTGILPSPFDVHIPAAVSVSFTVDGKDNALVSETFCTFPDDFRMHDGSGVHGHFIRPCQEHGAEIVGFADAAAYGKGNGELFRNGLHRVHKGFPPLVGGGNVVEHQLVGTGVGVELS